MMEENLNKFCLIGIVTDPDFQKCKSLIERLHTSFPRNYEKPVIVPMLDVDWNHYLIKIKRDIGGKLWEIRKPFVIFLNSEYLGDDNELKTYLFTKYKFGIVRDFHEQGQQNLLDILNKELKKERKYVYITIAIDERVVGTLLFLLYVDLVPDTSNLFLKRMRSKKNGFLNTPIHRIVKNGWIQCGGFDVKSRKLACENYIIPHNKRGVLSMSNNTRHFDNSIQFHVSLVPTSWMNYRYVAFGQLIHGDKVLSLIESIPTYYQSPTKNIKIVRTGEYLKGDNFLEDNIEDVEKYLEVEFSLREDNLDLRYVDSEMSAFRYKRGLYFHCDDLQSHLPFLHLPDYLMLTRASYVEEEAEEDLISEKTVIQEEERINVSMVDEVLKPTIEEEFSDTTSAQKFANCVMEQLLANIVE